MKLVQLVVVLAVAVAAANAGLLRVPRVYNALISTNQRLAPSRADTVSLPVVGPVALLPAAAAIVAEEPAPPPAAAKNASEAEGAPAAAANHTALPALVAPLAVYSPYYYSSYSYHYSPFLLPPPAPLITTYGYSYLPLAFAHPLPAAGDAKPEAKSGDAEAAPEGAKVDAEKDAVSVEAN